MPFRHCLHLCAVALATAITVWGQAPQASGTQPPAVIPIHSATTPIIHPQSTHVKTVAQTDTYFRIICVVPLVGIGKRPGFNPARLCVGAQGRRLISHWHYRLKLRFRSDDGKHAIVRNGRYPTTRLFKQFSTDESPDVVVFEHGKHTQAQMEAGIQPYKKGFSLGTFPRAVAR